MKKYLLLALLALTGCSPQVVKVPIPEPIDVPDELLGPVDRPYVLWYDADSYAGALVCVTRPHAIDLRDYIIRLETRANGIAAWASETNSRSRL